MHPCLEKEHELQEYLRINNDEDKLNLLNMLRHHERGTISPIVMKLMRLLLDINHPLYFKHRRMILVLTGYSLNWYKKNETVKEMRDQLK